MGLKEQLFPDLVPWTALILPFLLTLYRTRGIQPEDANTRSQHQGGSLGGLFSHFIIIFYLGVHVCVWICVYDTWGLELQAVVSCRRWGRWESNLSPLEEQHTLLTPESPL